MCIGHLAPVWGEETVQYERFGSVTLYGGTKNPSHVILFVSGDGGWNKGIIFLPAKNLDSPWIVLQGDIDQVCNPAETATFVKQVGSGRIVKLPKVEHGFSVQKSGSRGNNYP